MAAGEYTVSILLKNAQRYAAVSGIGSRDWRWVPLNNAASFISTLPYWIDLTVGPTSLGPTVLLGACVDLLAAHAVARPGEGQHLDAVVGVLLQPVQLQGGLGRGHVADLAQLCVGQWNRGEVHPHPLSLLRCLFR